MTASLAFVAPYKSSCWESTCFWKWQWCWCNDRNWLWPLIYARGVLIGKPLNDNFAELYAHLADDAPNDDMHELKTLFQNQQFQNLLNNGCLHRQAYWWP